MHRHLVSVMNRYTSGTNPYQRMGDGARTRDSLLGRQSVTGLPLACYKSAQQVHLALTVIILAPLTYYVAYIIRQYVLTLSVAVQTIPQACGKGKGGSLSTAGGDYPLDNDAPCSLRDLEL